jgi:hypothetical protein
MVRTTLVEGADHFYGSITGDRLDGPGDETVDTLLETADRSRVT